MTDVGKLILIGYIYIERVLAPAGALVMRWLSIFIVALLFMMPTASLAQEESEAIWDGLREQLFPDQIIEDGSAIMSLKSPYRASDASLVPISIHFQRPQNDQDHITEVTLIIDENPAPVAGIFHMTPESGIADIATRIRIDSYTDVRAVARTSSGKTYMVSSFVKASGGCSAPATADMDAAIKRIGKMKMKFLKNDHPNQKELSHAQLLISHPNYSGLQFNQITRTEIPAHYIDSITILRNETPVLSVDSSISISENPSIHFYYRNGGKDDALHVVATDSEGAEFTKTWKRPS